MPLRRRNYDLGLVTRTVLRVPSFDEPDQHFVARSSSPRSVFSNVDASSIPIVDKHAQKRKSTEEPYRGQKT